MTVSLPGRGTVLALTLLFVGPLAAQEPKTKPSQKEAYVGGSLFKTYCTTCHGLSGEGDGPLAEHLRFRPPDLTLIARRNEGKWEADKVSRIVDGRQPVKGHGGPDMPVWGDAFKSSREGYDEDAVKAKIQALVEYLASLQEGSAKPQK